MKYIYNICLSESEAHKLGIKLKEPVEGRYPKSKDWEIFYDDFGKLYILPALFFTTRKFQWEMKPSFSWTAKLILKKPLNPNDYFEIVTRAPLAPVFRNKVTCLALNDPVKSNNSLIWRSATKDIRSL